MRVTMAVVVVVTTWLGGCGASPSYPPEIDRQLTAFEEQTKWLRDLPAPDGTSLAGFGGGAADDYRFWNVRVEGTADSNLVGLHYEEHLSQLGWRAVDRLSEGTASIRTFQFRDEESRPWHAVLLVSPGVDQPGGVDVMIRQSRVAEALGQFHPQPNTYEVP